jgi:alkylresorcinol/alkylpyrone synthase
MAFLHAVATASAPHRYAQRELREVAAQALPEGPGTERLLGAFDNARIDSRAFGVPLEWLLASHGFKDRMEAFVAAGLPMAESAARQALANAGLAAGDVDAVVFVTTTGLAAPSLDARLANRLGLRRDVHRIPVWGLGCAGGVAGLARASELAGTGRRVLLVTLELCSVSFDVSKALSPGGADKKALVAASLFADGCAAVVLDGRTGPLRLRSSRSHLFVDSERVMGWDVLDHNLDVVLSPRIPDIVREGLPGIVQPYLEGLRPDHWVLHPGGAKVVEAYRDALGLGDAQLAPASRVLAAHGNMSSPTVLYALADTTIRSGETALLAALGPGFAAELALLEAT